MNEIRLLLENLYIETSKGFTKGYIYVLGDKIRDVGAETPPEYEFSEYVVDYNGYGVAFHGFSVLIDPLTYLLNIIDSKNPYELIHNLSKNDKKIMIENTLYILYKAGITLPIIHSEDPLLVINVLKEKKLSAILIEKNEELPKYREFIYIKYKDNKLFKENGDEIGYYNEVVCEINNINDKCRILSITHSGRLPTVIFSQLNNYEILYAPYKLLGIDAGKLDKDSYADILIYDLRLPLSNTFLKLEPGKTIKWGKDPDTVIVRGDIFFEKGEALVLEYHDLSSIIEELGG